MPLAEAAFHNINTLRCYTTCDLHVRLLDWLMCVNLTQGTVIGEEGASVDKTPP